MARGTVEGLNTTKGFGCIHPGGREKDVLVHQAAL